MKKNVVGFLEESYLKHPDKCVCADEGEYISYKELWEDSHIIAKNLLESVHTGMPVPILMKKSCKVLKLIWGVIKAGGAYVVVDPVFPEERIRDILQILGAKWVIGEQGRNPRLPEGMEVFCFESLIRKEEGQKGVEVDRRIEKICDIDPLYIMFTSGSTGKPKGIAANHRSVMDFIDCFVELFHINENDIIGNQAPWDFDVSVKDIFSTAKAGATLQIIPKKFFSLPVSLVDFLDERGVTTLIWAVSALCIISSNNLLEHKSPKAIQKVIFSGEVMPVKQYNLWRKHYPEAMFVNVYGPTEITCNCTYYITQGFYDEGDVIPIGKPFPNERVFLLDQENRQITESRMWKEVGEICVSGTAVTMGYYNDFEAGSLNFIQNPSNDKYREIIYRTGDLGYYNSDGHLCFAARKDFQIKHMGHRIELGEIEKVIYSKPEVKLCCCIYYKDEIIAFYTGETEKKEIISLMRKKLPAYMVPGKFERLDEMPLNKNGKIDRKRLMELLG